MGTNDGTGDGNGRDPENLPVGPETAPSKLAYTIPELSEAFGVSRAMLYREIKAERLKVKKVGKRTLVPVDEAGLG